MTHTPGPWTVNFTPAKDGPTAETFGPNAEANARLIASAPALLEALERARVIASCAPHDVPTLASQEFKRIMAVASAAIEAAKGD